MRNLFFWADWPVYTRTAYRICLFTLFILLVIYAWSVYSGRDMAFPTAETLRIEKPEFVYDQLRAGPIQSPLKADALLALQSFSAGPPAISSALAYIFLALYAICLVVLLSHSTTLPRFWFFVSMGLFALLLISLRLETLLVFSSYGKWALGTALFLFLLPAYYLAIIKPRTALNIRMAVFGVVTIVFGVFLSLTAETEQALFHLACNSYYSSLVLTIVFAFMVGHEIPAAFLRAITHGSTRGGVSNLYHFIAVSILLVGNSVLLYLENTGLYRHNLFTVNAWWLLAISAVLGIWGYRQRAPVYEPMYSFRPAGAFIFMALAFLAFGNISIRFLQGNDSALESIEDAVVLGQLAYSTAFFLYIIANFFTLLYRNVDFSGILYRPPRMPYTTARIAGAVIILALFLKGNSVPYYQAISGYYTALGDLHYATGSPDNAEVYYRNASLFFRYNHRANYVLGIRDWDKYRRGEAIIHFMESVQKNPSPQAYLALSELYDQDNRYFDALFAIQDGLARFPGDGRLLNNLGLHYLNIKSSDSAYFYLEKAIEKKVASNKARANLWALAGLQRIDIPDGVIGDLYGKSRDTLERSNLLALALAVQKHDIQCDCEKWPVTFPTGRNAQVHWVNHMLYHPAGPDSAVLRSIMVESGTTAGELALASSAFALYREAEVARAFDILSNLLGRDENISPRYAGWMGQMALSEGAPRLAADLLGRAFSAGQMELSPELAIAYLKAGRADSARDVLRRSLPQADSASRPMLQLLLSACSSDMADDPGSWNQEQLFIFCTTHHTLSDPVSISSLIKAIEDPQRQAYAAALFIAHLLQSGNGEKADLMLRKFKHLITPATDPEGVLYKAYLDRLLGSNQIDLLEAALQAVPIPEPRGLRAAVQMVRISLKAETDPGSEMDSLFRLAGYRNPFYEEAVLGSSAYFRDKRGEPATAYDILLKALRFNPYSLRIQEAYMLQCLEMGLRSYAEAALQEYRQLAGEKAYTTFLPRYLSAIKAWEQSLDDWN